MKVIMNLIKKIKTSVYNNWCLDTKIGGLVEVLQLTLDNISGTHVGKQKQYWTRLCRDEPWEYELPVYNKTGKVFTSFSISEMLKILSTGPVKCYEYIENKILKESKNEKI